MEALSREVLAKTGYSLVVATFETSGGQDIESFATELFKAWGIGRKGEDKGVLLVLALKERQFRIEVGYGAEGVLPDGLAGRIMRQAILPQFKTGNFGQGFEDGLTAIAQVLAKESGVELSSAKASPVPAKTGAGSGGWAGGLILLVFLALIFSRMRRGRTGMAGALPWFLMGTMMGSGFGRSRSFGGFGGGFGGFGGGLSGGGGVSGRF